MRSPARRALTDYLSAQIDEIETGDAELRHGGGDHQDTVVATETLRQMALAAGTAAGENGFSYGMPYAREQQLARQCREDALALV